MQMPASAALLQQDVYLQDGSSRLAVVPVLVQLQPRSSSSAASETAHRLCQAYWQPWLHHATKSLWPG